MINSILNQGETFKLEKFSYKAFQKLFGKSCGLRAPGLFVSHLKRKAENAGGRCKLVAAVSPGFLKSREVRSDFLKSWRVCSE